MKTRLLPIIGLLLASLNLSFGQTDISIDIKNYESDTMIFGYYLAERMLVHDTLIRQNNEPFQVQQDTALAPGMYIIVSVPQGLFYQVIMNDDEQDFDVVIDTMRSQQVTFTDSKENKLFYDYLGYINDARLEIQRLDQVIAQSDSTLISVVDQLEKDKVTINNMVTERQNKIVEQFPESVVSILIKANNPMDFPQFTGTDEEIQNERFKYYKEHYFDHVDLNNRSILRTPIAHERINYYEESLTHKEPDSIIKSVDYILDLMGDDSEIYRFYLSYFINKYANSKYIGMDAVYVHLALEYYNKGRASWITEENRKEIVGNAQKLAPVLIGKTAPDFKITKEDGGEIVLSELDNDYNIIVFWKPSCGHCTKAMPHIVEFQEKYKDRGIQVIAVCTERGKKFETCWEGVKEKGMESLLNGGDEYGLDRTVAKYYATSTPMIYVLDGDRKIMIKKVPAENLGAVMDSLMKQDQEILK